MLEGMLAQVQQLNAVCDVQAGCGDTFFAMFLTDWSTQPVDTPIGSYAVSLQSFWVKIGSQWLCLLMYAWTLLAPYLLRHHRDFGIEFDF